MDEEKTEIQAIHRETYEETGLSIPHKRFKYIKNDKRSNCDVYICQLINDEVPQRTEPDKASDWIYYPWKMFRNMAVQEEITFSLIRFASEIIRRCMNFL